MWKGINSMANNNTMISLNTLDIHIDTTIHRNDIKNHIDLQFKTIYNHEEIDQLLAAGNAQHLHQVHITPFTVEPLRTLIGKDSFTPFSQKILDGSANFHTLDISDSNKLYLQNLKRKKVKGKINNKGIISLKEFKQGYKQWKERTTASLSGRHLGHYHALLAPDGEEKERTFTEDMWRIHNDNTNIALLNKIALTKWVLSIVILLPKDNGKPKIHRLHIINTYENDYNLILKVFWSKKGMHQAEKRQWLGDNQTGGRK